jgi:hypothetical protein
MATDWPELITALVSELDEMLSRVPYARRRNLAPRLPSAGMGRAPTRVLSSSTLAAPRKVDRTAARVCSGESAAAIIRSRAA